KSKDEIAMYHQPQLLRIFRELAGTLNRGAFLDVLENLRIAGFVTDNQQAAAGFTLRLQRLVVGGHARSARPGQVERLQFGTKLDCACFLNVEGIVVEEIFLHPRPILSGLRHLPRHCVCGALAPRMPAERLRPQAESALCRAATSGVERDK